MDSTPLDKSHHKAVEGLWWRSVLFHNLYMNLRDRLAIRSLLPAYLERLELFGKWDEGAIVGFVALSDGSDVPQTSPSPRSHISLLFVDPDFMGRRIGHELLHFTLAQGATKLEVDEDNQHAREFYEDEGFRVFDRKEKDTYPLAGSNLELPYPFLYMRREK